jgi:membrane protein YqaA with SNARE-associated domain
LGVKLPAIAWGLAEATVFFIVPDVLLTYLALKDPRRATKACLWTLVGVLVGGTAMFCWGHYDPKSATGLLTEIPAIDEELLNKVEQQIDDDGVKATFFGPIAGRPYKIYAVYAGAKDISFPSFLLVSIPARLLRFILLTWITWWVANKLLTKLQTRQKAFVLTAVWIGFYSWYFAIM